MITTVIGAYPKPSFLQLPDWFNADGGTDTNHPTENYNEAIKIMGDEKESIFLKSVQVYFYTFSTKNISIHFISVS